MQPLQVRDVGDSEQSLPEHGDELVEERVVCNIPFSQ